MGFKQYDFDKVINFLVQHEKVKTVTIPANTVVATEGQRCLDFSLVLEGKIKVYKASEDGKQITLYHINKQEGCILTSASIFSNLPFPAMAQTITTCKVLVFSSELLSYFFNQNLDFRGLIFSLLSNKMAGLVMMVDDLAFHKLDERLFSWLSKNNSNGVVDMTHQVIAEQLGSSREVISRSLKTIEKKGLVKLSRGKIIVL